MDDRLPTWLWADALIRRVQQSGASCFVLQRGDRERGGIILKVADLTGGARVYVPRTSMDGERVFVDLRLQGVGEREADVDAYLARARERDPDTWILEVEDRQGRHFLTEPVEQPDGERS